MTHVLKIEPMIPETVRFKIKQLLEESGFTVSSGCTNPVEPTWNEIVFSKLPVNTNDYQLRVVNEHEELEGKLVRLGWFIQDKTFAGIDRTEQVRLSKQYGFMEAYLNVLVERMENF